MNLRNFGTKSVWSAALVAALGFAIASVLSLLTIALILHSRFTKFIVDSIGQGQPLQRLVMAIVFLILGLALSGAVLGGIGGWVLSWIDKLAPRRRYIWSGAISYAVSQTIMIAVLLLIATLMALYYNNIDARPEHLALFFAVFGLLYGLISGLLLGFASVGFKYGWSVLLASMFSGAAGGAIVGIILKGISTIERASSKVFTIWWIILLYAIFFAITGAVFGLLFAKFDRKREESGSLPGKMGWGWKVIVIVAIVLLAVNIGTLFSQLYSFAKMQPASASKVISNETIGVAWSDVEIVPESRFINSSTLDVVVDSGDDISVVWVKKVEQSSELLLSVNKYDEYGQRNWLPTITVSKVTGIANHPQAAIDRQGDLHIVWEEQSFDEKSDKQVLYTHCTDKSCTSPISLSDVIPDCAEKPSLPVIAIDEAGQIMVVWQTESGKLFSSVWNASDSPAKAETSCIPITAKAGHPQIIDVSQGNFLLAYDTDGDAQLGDVALLLYRNGRWDTKADAKGVGQFPSLYKDTTGDIHIAWCGKADKLNYLSLSGNQNIPETIDFPRCVSQPVMSEDGYGHVHVIWQSDEIANNFDVVSQGNFLYESSRLSSGWRAPVVVTQVDETASPSLVTDKEGTLYLTWLDKSPGIRYMAQPVYQCDETTGSYLGDAILDVLNNAGYRAEGEIIPFCRNEFIKLLYMPMAEPAFSSEKPTEYGGFDDVDRETIKTKYEVLFATMEWMKDQNYDSPGFYYAKAVTNLYKALKEHPERYPKGITVRILLGNYPELATMRWGDQIWYVMDVLQKAGLPELENPELGWKLEVANYDGQLPHSHTKFLIVDGKVVTAAGFNYSYLHLSKEHPSGLGESLLDLGMMIKGPVAQQALADYDDLWSGSDQVSCPDLNPPDGDWESYCHFVKAKADHIPEVMLYHPMEKNDIAFSLMRTAVRPESDKALEAAIRATREKIDIFEVNFSLKTYCALGAVMEGFCTYNDALPYMEALMDAMEKNGVKIRVLVTNVNMNGIENSVAIKAFKDELEKRELSDQAEFRYYEGRMHTKAFLMDDEMLVVGSQNFHYSAWGDGKGLSEYNLVTDSDKAITEFKNLFEYRWEQSIPIE